jgi:peptidyl-tRNA hydrolase, PTH1 family
VSLRDLVRQALGRGRDTSAMSTSRTGTVETGSGVWLVVGLGNPGPSYAGHRHNVGYLVTDELAARMGSPFRSHKSGRADVVEGRLGTPGGGGARVVLARPRCYMNETGGPVKALATFYKVAPERIVAVHDELDIPFGTLRVKLGGGDNGHNGLRSMRSSLGTGDFFRVRAGHRPSARSPGRRRLRAVQLLLDRAQGAALPGRPRRGRGGVAGARGPRADAADVQRLSAG